ncbi:MAG TPA: TolC family protein [Longimicrobiales bacterium]|nr:TolC family protein [Longimicrobiales bacterium]
MLRRTARVPIYGMRALLLALLMLAAMAPRIAHGQETRVIDLTLDRLVELGLRDSYRVRQLQMDIQRTRTSLKAEQAGLRSRVDLNISTPDFQQISDYKWNSTLQRNELISSDTRRWEASLSVRQPVILFGFPTNGYLSLNNRVYRYTQLGDDDKDITYYNRYFVAYQQPFFQPNRMRNQLEGAQLDVERSELEFQDNVVNSMNELANDYFELFATEFERAVAAQALASMERAAAAARSLATTTPARAIEQDQLRVAVANASEKLQQTASSFRLQSQSIKQRLRLPATDSLTVDPVLDVVAVDIPVEQAIQLATSLAPRMRRLAISRRDAELRLDETRGRDAFRMNVSMTYGRETQDPEFERMWTEPKNSYTVKVDGYVPLWDWGQRKYRIEAEQYSLSRNDLQAEQAHAEIDTNVRNEVRNLQEYSQRALNMQSNLTLAREITASTLEQYGRGEVSLVDVLQTIDRQTATAGNALSAYLGYRRTLLRLERLTFYDFQRGAPLLERFNIGALSNNRP